MDTKPWKDKKDHRAQPPLTGTLTCPRGHERFVIDLNPERVAVDCAQCGFPISIRQGFKP